MLFCDVDINNFFLRSILFVEHIKDLTTGQRKVLLVYDGYRSRMSFRFLKLLHESGVVVFALLVYTSENSQPYNVVLYDIYKRALNSMVEALGDVGGKFFFDNWSYGALMCEAYKRCLKRRNLQATFRKSGIWLAGPSRLLGVTRLGHFGLIKQADKLREGMNNERKKVRQQFLRDEMTVLVSGFVDTLHGAILTSAVALVVTEECATKRKERVIENVVAREEKLHLDNERRE